MCKQMNKKKKEEEEEEDEEQDHTSSSFDQPDDQYSQQQEDDDDDDEEEEEVDVSNMTPITSETINRIRRSSSQMEKSRIIVDSSEDRSPSRSSSTLTNTDSSPSSTKFTIDEILKPDFGICKVRKVRHHRPLQQDLALLSFQHRPQVISFGPTGSVIIPMSHYATSLYSSTSSLAPPPLPSTLPPPPVVVPASGSLSSLSSSSPLLSSSSSSSSSSLVRYGSDSISPSSLGLHHHHLQNHHHKQLSSSSSTTIHTFKQTRQHHNHQRPHQHSQSHGSLGSYHQNSSTHSHRNHTHHHFQHPQNRNENSTNQQHVHNSRSQQHHQSQHHSSSNSNSVQKPEPENHHRSNRDTFSGKPLQFLNSSGTVSDFTAKERDSDICNSPPATSLVTTTKNNGHTLKNKKANINNTISGDPNISPNQPSTNSQTTSATVYEGTAPFVWPAWVYCTRYSDRPSSDKLLQSENSNNFLQILEGPRSRKIKKRDRSADEKRPRTSFTSDQLQRLKQEFDDCRYLTEERRKKLARDLCLSEAQIKIWFQNKRAKIKKSSGVKNPLALHLMAQGLYNHSTVSIEDENYA